MSAVYKVVPQASLDYAGTVAKMRPAFFVHGTDWRTGPQKEARQLLIAAMKKWGGRLIEPEYTGGISSTLLNQAVKEIGTTPQVRLARLRRLLHAKPLIRGIEAHNGISGLIAEHASATVDDRKREFDFLWSSSLTDSTAKGKPDIELVDITSRITTLHDILEVTTKPIIFDGDTGGLVERFPYMVRTLERLGVSAVIIEDKRGLKQNSLFGTEVEQELEDPAYFARKIHAGKQAQVTDDFMIIARLESMIAGQGVEDALARAAVYIEAGADGIMVHSKEKTPDEVLAFCAAYKKMPNRVPLVAVPSTYDTVTEAQLQSAGVNIVIYANHLLRSAYPAMLKTAESILAHGRAHEASEEYCMPVREILRLIERKDHGTR